MTLLLLLLACAPKSDVRTYDNSLFQLASGFSAKEMCSCLFVSGRPEAECKEYTKVDPAVAHYHVDWDGKSVRATALAMGRTSAHWVDERSGCVIDER